jgi:S1-C subfamily serine protease
LREVTAISGLVRHGNSGGPAVNSDGAVEATVFAARIGARAGYGVPAAPVRGDLLRARKPVSTGRC